jgi:predicted nuclease with RNAse H fold
MCSLTWGERLDVTVAVGVDDGLILECLMHAEGVTGAFRHVVAIDAPFGWPRKFSEGLNAWVAGEEWASVYSEDSAELRLRQCDRFLTSQVGAGKGRPPQPLSSSADKLGATTMRCVSLLSRWMRATQPRPGCVHAPGLPVVECYPAAALWLWNVDRTGYKRGKDAGSHRRRIVDEIANALNLTLTGDTAQLSESDHVLDAFVAALVARAVALGLVHRREELVDPHEGWIELPACNLDDLKASGA